MTPRDPLERAAWTLDVDVLVVVGAPRSGTTWLQSLLASHPGVVTGPETHFFRSFADADREFRRRRDRPVGVSEYWTSDQFRQVVERLFWGAVSALEAPDIPARYFLEKTPIHCKHAEFILRVLPRARFLHVIRDGRAVAASLLRAASGWGSDWAPDTIWRAADRWGDRVRSGRAIRDLVPEASAYREVRYEDVRRDPAGHLGELFRWLGLKADAGLLERAVGDNALDTGTGRDFGTIPMAGASENTRSTEAYPEGFVGPAPVDPADIDLTDPQVRKFELHQGQLLTELGYPLRYARGGALRRALLSDRLRGLFRLPPI
ncbi:MAG: sulfotransferase [Gemmatimonadota bacterium]